MINYTPRLDKALAVAAKSHDSVGQTRKGTDIPYIIHPVAVAMIASEFTEDEDVLLACLLHDVLEDVTTKDPEIYNETMLQKDFGDRVLGIILDVTKDTNDKIWRSRSEKYLNHLENKASDEAVLVSAADKTHNLMTTVEDYKTVGDKVWHKFTTKSKSDQIWWYESIIEVLKKRDADPKLIKTLESLLEEVR